jgi:hypothetical protein
MNDFVADVPVDISKKVRHEDESPVETKLLYAGRYHTMYTFGQGLSPNDIEKKHVMMQRSKSTRVWKSKKPDPDSMFVQGLKTYGDSKHVDKQGENVSFADDTMTDEERKNALVAIEKINDETGADKQQKLSVAETKAHHKLMSFCTSSIEKMSQFISLTSSLVSTTNSGTEEVFQFSIERVNSVKNDLKTGKLEPPLSQQIDTCENQNVTRVEHSRFKPTTLQKKAIDMVLKSGTVYLNDRDKYEPLKLLIQGGPGSGKSTCVINEIKIGLGELGLPIQILSFMAIAAVQVGGRTIHSIFKLQKGNLTKQSQKDMSDSVRTAIKCLLEPSDIPLFMVLIDEVSTLSPVLFNHINWALQQVYQNNEPFGGIAVVLVGDFYQLPPSGEKQTLVDVLVKKYVFNAVDLNEHSVTAAELFRPFKKIELIENLRASEDPLHSLLVQKLRSTNLGEYPLEEHFFKNKVYEKYILKDDDVRNDIGNSIMQAPCLVTGNFLKDFIVSRIGPNVARL